MAPTSRHNGRKNRPALALQRRFDVAEARGQRAMIESLDITGRTFISTVKWDSLCELGGQLF
jgi:hypothetical protein